MDFRLTFLSLMLGGTLTTGAASQVYEDFENYNVSSGTMAGLNVGTLDENSVINGQGPGLVQDGCVYSCIGTGTLAWVGAGFYGTTSKCLTGSKTMELTYDTPVRQATFYLVNYTLNPTTEQVIVFDATMQQIRSDYYYLPDATPVRVNYSASSIGKIQVYDPPTQAVLGVDSHSFSISGGRLIALSGSCPGTMTASFTGFAPNANFALLHSGYRASWEIPSGNSCAGEVLGLLNPSLLGIFHANAAGSLNLTRPVPAAFCGRYLQAVELGSCLQSNVIQVQ